MKLSCLIDSIEEFAPLSFQEKWDNAGLQVGNPEMEISAALLCIDVTETVLDEAIALKCQVVISHHPLIFHGLKTLQGRTYVERCVLKAVQNNIALYAAHTNIDNWLGGVNRRMADKIGLCNCRILLSQGISEKGEPIGFGLIGELPTPETEQDFLTRIKSIFKAPAIRYTALLHKPVRKVALCGGAGSFLLPDAIAQGADMFVSADFKYHEFYGAENRIVIADIGHYESEQYTKEIFFELISKKNPTFAIHFSKKDKSPINYL